MARVAVTAELVEPKLLAVKDFCKYISVGERTGRKMLAEPNCPYRIRLGGKIFANKPILDKWLDSQTGI